MQTGLEVYPPADVGSGVADGLLSLSIGAGDPASLAAWEESASPIVKSEAHVFYNLVSDDDFIIGYMRSDDEDANENADYLVFYVTGGCIAEGEGAGCTDAFEVGQGEDQSVGTGDIIGHT